MNLNITIEHLRLDGIALAPDQKHLLRTHIETALGRMLTQGGLASHLHGGGAYRNAPAQGFALGRNLEPAVLGERIAQSIYRGIGL